MKLFYIVAFAVVLVVHNSAPARGQNLSDRELAQLTKRIKSHADNVAKVNMLLKVGDHLMNRASVASALDSAKPLYRDVERISRKINYDSGILASVIGEARILIALRENAVQQGKQPKDSLADLYKWYEKAIHLEKPKRRAKGMGDLYFQLAQLAPARNPYVKYSRILYDSSASFYHRAHERDRESLALSFSGESFHAHPQFDSAMVRYRKSIDVMQGAIRADLAVPYSLIGNIYMFNGDNKRALEYFHKAADLAAAQDSVGQAYGLVNMFLGMVYQRLHEPKLQLYHYRKAFRIYEPLEKNYSDDLIYAATGTAQTLTAQDPDAAIAFLNKFIGDHPDVRRHAHFHMLLYDKLTAYYKLKDYSRAQKYYDTLSKLADNRQLARHGRYPSAINLFIDTRQFKRAAHLLKGYRVAANRQRSRLLDLYYLQFRLDSAQGNFKAAIESYMKYKQLNDSILDEAKMKEIAHLNISYETEKKEQSIALLKQDAAIQTIALGEAKLVRNGIIAGTIILTIVLALVYSLYRGRMKASEELEKQRNEIALQNRVLERMVGEKEWLLKEVHHRVKNNLHMISGLLSMQAHELRDNSAKSAILDSQNRVYAMSIVHQKLYSDERISFVNFSNYVTDLVDHLKQSLDTEKIRFDVVVAPITIDAHMAISLGLVINEAITNSIKYAFSNMDGGTVSISLREAEGDLWKLTIQDDGAGTSNDSPAHKSIGMTLIEGIAEELDGNLKIDGSNGFNIQITFPINPNL